VKFLIFLLVFFNVSFGFANEDNCAVASDWKVIPLGEEKVFIPIDLSFSLEEFRYIKKGHIPQCMDDRWFIYVEDERIHIHRSWTGIEIYDCLFNEDENGISISGFFANRNWSQYNNQSEQHDIELLTYLLYSQIAFYSQILENR
jgi:hypothetical protein